MEETHREFLSWSASYDDPAASPIRAAHEAYLQTATCPVVRLDAPLTPSEQLAAVLARL